MWYSAIRTGINDIDLDHANIDFLLGRILQGEMNPEHLGKLLAALISHFNREEKIIAALGAEFPADHKAEHQRLASTLRDKESRWQAGDISPASLALWVKECLILHVSSFDMQLPELLARTPRATPPESADSP